MVRGLGTLLAVGAGALALIALFGDGNDSGTVSAGGSGAGATGSVPDRAREMIGTEQGGEPIYEDPVIEGTGTSPGLPGWGGNQPSPGGTVISPGPAQPAPSASGASNPSSGAGDVATNSGLSETGGDTGSRRNFLSGRVI